MPELTHKEGTSPPCTVEHHLKPSLSHACEGARNLYFLRNQPRNKLCRRYLSTNSDDSDWQPHPSVSSKAAARQGPAWKDTSAAAEPNPKPGPWWRFGLGTAKRGDADETASLLPKQAVPLSFDIPEFRRQHATGEVISAHTPAFILHVSW